MRLRTRGLAGMSLASVLLVTAGTAAWAHATFDKSQVPAETEIDLTFRAPQERASTNAKIEALAPRQWTILDCTAPPAWTCDIDTESQAPDTVLTWEATADAIVPQIQFTFFVRTPDNDEQGVYAWPVIQTYDDGFEAEWIGEDAPTIQVGDSDDPVVENSEPAEPHEEPSEDPTTAPQPEPTSSEASPEPTATSSASEAGPDASPEPSTEASASDAPPSGQEPVGTASSEPATTSTDAAAPASTDDDGGGTGLLIAVIALAVLGGIGFALRGRLGG